MTLQFHTVTWYSRFIALIFFLAVLPVWTFYIGTQYQKTIDQLEYVDAHVEYKKSLSVAHGDVDNPQLQNVRSELVRIKTEGGLCREGICTSEVVLYADGFVHVVSPIKKTYTISKSTVENLKREIEVTDFKKIMSVPFTEICPMAYDGDRVTYTFYTSGGVRQFDSCTVQVDIKTQPFDALWKILSQMQ